MITVAPSVANASATPAPIPEDDPVIIAILFSNTDI
jgi:hypothetical protein